MSRNMDNHFVALQTALAGRYSLERELGRGGMGVVYLAHEVSLDRPVALKLLPPEVAGQADVRERFLTEARTAAKLSHPHIVPIFAVDEVDDFVFFAMAAIPGETLGERVRAKGPLTSADATRLMKEVAWALAYAHAQGVVHRDIKPDNILLEDGSGRALVTDFGIADVGADEDVERVSQVVGTAEFMSPEQAKGAAVDSRSDLYSLAAVGFFAVSGRAPFEGPSPAAVLGRHVTEAAAPLASIAPGVSASLAGVVDRCLRKEPERRFLGGESIADALEQDVSFERQLPVPLRVFIKKMREQSQSATSLAVLLAIFVLPMTIGIIAATGLAGAVASAAVLASIVGAFGLTASWQARKVLKSGFTIEETRLALLEDVNRRNEEIRFEMGPRTTGFDKVLNVVTAGALGVALVALLGIFALGEGAGSALWQVVSAGLLGGLGSALVRQHRASRRADLVGERWLKVWGSRVGDWMFRLGGFRLDAPTTLPSGVHRSTEVALGLAAAKLYEDLPKENRRELGDLPETVRRLEVDARALRGHVKELNAVLAELGDDPTAAGAGARESVRRDVEATRDTAEGRLRDVVTALETIRVGLLRMHAGESIVHSVTMELDAARGLSGDMDHLLEGHRAVERLLAERRATGTFTIPEALLDLDR